MVDRTPPMLQRLTKECDKYLTGRINSSSLEKWLLQNLQDVLDSADTRAIYLADQIDALFIEMGEGLVSEDELKDTIWQLVSSVRDTVVITAEPARSEPIRSASIAETVRKRFTNASLDSDFLTRTSNELEMEFA